MNVLNLADCEKWLSRQNFSDFRTMWRSASNERFSVPDQPSSRAAMARILAELMSDGELLLLLVDIDVWSYHFPWVYSRLVASGETSDPEQFIANNPGVAFTPADKDQLAAIIAVCWYFYWDFMLVSSRPHFWIRIDHDDRLAICSEHPGEHGFDAELIFAPRGVMKIV